MVKILVTGGAGFIGYNISKILSENPKNQIDIIDDLSKGTCDSEFRELINKENINFYKADLTDINAYGLIESNYDQIYHLAAVVGVRNVMENPVKTLKVNSLSTIYLLEKIKDMTNTPKILFTSSCENYAGTVEKFDIKIPTGEDVPLCIEDIYNPRWTYAASKILSELACFNYSKAYGFDSTIIRYHNVYGPRMGDSHVIPEFILRLKKNPFNMEMFGGYQYRSFCYVTDAAKMTIKLMNNNTTNNKVINIGGEEFIKISKIAELLSKIMGISPKFIEKNAPKGSVNKRMPDLSLIKNLDCYVSEVSFDKGLKQTYEWYNKYNKR